MRPVAAPRCTPRGACAPPVRHGGRARWSAATARGGSPPSRLAPPRAIRLWRLATAVRGLASRPTAALRLWGAIDGALPARPSPRRRAALPVAARHRATARSSLRFLAQQRNDIDYIRPLGIGIGGNFRNLVLKLSPKRIVLVQLVTVTPKVENTRFPGGLVTIPEIPRHEMAIAG